MLPGKISTKGPEGPRVFYAEIYNVFARFEIPRAMFGK